MLRPREVTAVMRRIEPLLSPQATFLGAQIASLTSGNLTFSPLHGDAVVLAHEAVIYLRPPGMMGLPAGIGRGGGGSGEGRGQSEGGQGHFDRVHDV